MRKSVYVAVLFSVAASGVASAVPITNGDAGGGVVLDPTKVIYAVDFFPLVAGGNTVQSVAFQNDIRTDPTAVSFVSSAYPTTPGGSTYFVTDTVSSSPGATAAHGQASSGPDATVTFDNASTSSAALLSILNGINYGQQHVVIAGLSANTTYNVQLLVSDGGYNERKQDTTYSPLNGSITDTGLDVMEGKAFNVTNNVVSDATGTITFDLTPNSSSGDLNPVLGGLVVSSVPEPGSLCFLGLSGAALLARRRRA